MSTSNRLPKDPFDIWLELLVLLVVAPLVGLIGGTWRFIHRAVRRFNHARRQGRSAPYRSTRNGHPDDDR